MMGTEAVRICLKSRRINPLAGRGAGMKHPHDPGKVVWEDKHQVLAEPGGRRF